jgi:DNA-binding protein HU-beta
MTKAQLIEAVAGSAGVSKADAERTLDSFFDHVVSATKQGEKVAWPGFGSFSTSQSAARTGRNPQTGAAVKIAASTRLKFSSSSTLKAALNAKKAAAKKAAPAAKKAASPAKKAAKKK